MKRKEFFMKGIILSTSLTLLSFYAQGVTAITTNCAFGSSSEVSFSYDTIYIDDTKEKEDFLPFYSESINNNVATICHYSTSKKTFTYETISVSSAISMVEKTSNYGTGHFAIPETDVKQSLSLYDNRVEIKYSSTNNGYPFSAIGMINGNLDGTTYNGSIFMAHGGFGITAAHCVYNKSGQFLNNLQSGFKLSKILSTSHIEFEYGSYISDVYVPKEYVDFPENANYDWAVVKFNDTTLEKSIGSLTIGSGFSMYDRINTAVGFPADKGFNPYSSSGKGTIETTERYYDLYQYVSEGMSGGPVIFDYFDSYSLDEYMVVSGIISQKVESPNFRHLRATQISNALISLVRLLK